MRKAILRAALLFCILLFAAGAVPAKAAENVAEKISAMNKKYKSAPTGGVALVGSSSIARWSNAGDLFQMYGVNRNKVYNFGINSSTNRDWNRSDYIRMVAAKRPGIVVIYGGINRNINNTVTFVNNLDRELRKNRAVAKFVFVSIVKTPQHYANSGLKNAVTCPSWDSIDKYNTSLKNYAAKHKNIFYVDIEQYFYYRNSKGQLRYYISRNKLKDTSKVANAQNIITGKTKNPLFASDLSHPSELAYNAIWKILVRRTLGK